MTIQRQHANMHISSTPMPNVRPVNSSQAIFDGDYEGVEFLEKRESDRLINAAEFTDTSLLPKIFQEGGLYKVPQATIPYLSNPDGSVRAAKSQAYVSFDVKADGSVVWQIIAQPMLAQIKPFYFSRGVFDVDSSEAIRKFSIGDEDESPLDLFFDTLQEPIMNAGSWGAVTFERSAAGQIRLPDNGSNK